MNKQIKKEIFRNQIYRLAKIYLSKEITAENSNFHHRIVKLINAIKEKEEIK